MQATKFNTQKDTQNYYFMAYKIADDFMEDVMIIWEPRAGMEYHSGLSYIVPVSCADAWEIANGQRIAWRLK